MKEHVKTFEEAKVVIKQHAEEVMKTKQGQKTYKLRALFVGVVGLGVASCLALLTKQPALIPAFLPSIGISSLLCLLPLLKQKIAYNKIMNDTAFKEKDANEIIYCANRYIDQDNLTERIRKMN